MTTPDYRSSRRDQHADPMAHRALTFMLTAHLLGALIASLQRLSDTRQINNFRIFRSSFWHLLRGQDLYAAYPAEYADLYKYSPSFAFLFAPFASLPIPAGVIAWNLLNAVSLCAAVSYLLPQRMAAWTLGIVFFEALCSMQNLQSNGLVAALMIVAFLAAEREQFARGAWAICAGTSIKLFPVGAALFGVLHRRRWRHLVWCLAAGAVLVMLPLVVTSLDTLLAQYQSWARLEARDHAQPGMMWIGGALEWLTGSAVSHTPIQIFGVLWMLLSTALVAPRWAEDAIVRRLLLASMLGFATVFNHQAESPSYVIAFTGLGIWWSVLPRARWRDAVVFGAFIFGSLSGTDIAPRAWHRVYYFKWQLKAIMSTIAWSALQWDLWCAIRASRTLQAESAVNS